MSEHPTPPTPPAPADAAPLLEGHTYDGIQEYDNPLPGWWKGLFWLTVLFAIPYTIWYHLLGNDVRTRYDEELAARAAAQAAEEPLPSDGPALLALLGDEEALEKGEAVWARTCAACHQPDGGGLVGLGPNMTDDHYKNVKTIGDLYTVVRDGVSGTAMVPWSATLTHNEMVRVSVYVASLRGTTPAAPKEPEGEVIPAWGEG